MANNEKKDQHPEPIGPLIPPFPPVNYSEDVLKIFTRYVDLMKYCAKYTGVLQFLLHKPHPFLTNGEGGGFNEMESYKGQLNDFQKYKWPNRGDMWPATVGLILPLEMIIQFDSNLAWPEIHIVRKEQSKPEISAPIVRKTTPGKGWNLLRISEARNIIKYQFDNEPVVSKPTVNEKRYKIKVNDSPESFVSVLTMPLFIPVVDEILEVHFLDAERFDKLEILLTCS